MGHEKLSRGEQKRRPQRKDHGLLFVLLAGACLSTRLRIRIAADVVGAATQRRRGGITTHIDHQRDDARAPDRQKDVTSKFIKGRILQEREDDEIPDDVSIFSSGSMRTPTKHNKTHSHTPSSREETCSLAATPPPQAQQTQWCDNINDGG